MCYTSSFQSSQVQASLNSDQISALGVQPKHMSQWCQSGWGTYICCPPISWRMETLWSTAVLPANKLWIHRENVIVFGTEPPSLPLLPEMDRNKCLSIWWGASTPCPLMGSEHPFRKAILRDFIQEVGSPGHAFQWSYECEFIPLVEWTQHCNSFWTVAFSYLSKKLEHLDIWMEFGTGVESW